MRRSTCCLLVVLFGSWLSSFGQSAPKLTSPKIVATFQRLGLTADLPPTTIYTPKNWGTFRVSIVMVGTVSNQQYGQWTGQLQFTDGAGQNGPNTFVVQLTTSILATGSGDFPIRAQAGKPLKFSVSSFITQGAKYNVWIVVEQLM
jgi:hypothetical protein